MVMGLASVEGEMVFGPTLHAHGRRLSVKLRLRWSLAALIAANVALWSLVFAI